jgi:hypothetical protein
MSRMEDLLSLFELDSKWRDPNPERSHVTAKEHALLCATKALRHDPNDHEMITAALLHDAARPLTDVYHGEAIAWILKDRVRPEVFTALLHHGELQDALLKGTALVSMSTMGLPKEAWALASWDFNSFDPNEHMEGVVTFIPHLVAVLG